MAIETQKPQGQDEQLYTPPGPQPIVFEDFSGGLNTNSTRPGIKENELWWSDGFFPIAPNYLRTIPDVGPFIYEATTNTPVVSFPDVWTVTNTCHFLPFVKTDTGNVAPVTDAQYIFPSVYLAMDFDTTAGTYFVLRNFTDTHTFEIDVFLDGATGMATPVYTIGTSAFSVFTENSFGGLTLDASKNIYAGNQGIILKFASGASGDASATELVNDGSIKITSLFYDAARQLIWLSAGAGTLGGSGGPCEVRAYDLSGTQQRRLTCPSIFGSILGLDQVYIGPDGSIFVAHAGIDANLANAAICYVFSPNADGTDLPARTISVETIENSRFLGPAGVAVDADGTTFLCYAEALGTEAHIVSVSPTQNGIIDNVTTFPLTDITGSATLMTDISGDFPQQLRMGP